MSSPRNIALAEASALVDRTLAEARARQLKPIAVAVLDTGGQLIAFKREDQSSLLRNDIAMGKAWAVVAAGVGARELVRRATNNPHFYNALSASTGGKMIPGIGGVLIRDADGTIIGAVGVSGDSSDNDEACAVAAITQSGLRADTGT